MARKRATTTSGSSFSQKTIDAVWEKAQVVHGVDADYQRKDAGGAWIRYDLYGDTTDDGMGWEIDHILPVSKGGTDALSNLQPLQWQNNRHKGNDYPVRSYLMCAKN